MQLIAGLLRAGSGPGGQILIFRRRHPYPNGKGLKQRASYARWALVASAVRTTDRYQITYDTTEKDKNLCNKLGPSL
jgi:hypothetical protein